MKSRNVLLIIAGVLGILGMAAIAVAVMAMVIPEGSPTVETPGPPHHSAQAIPVVEPPFHDLNGTWTADMGDGNSMVATVVNDTIQIVMKNNEMTMIYWNGTFRPSGAIGDVILSTKIEITKAVMSRANDKRFVVGNETMTFELTAMGVTKTMELVHAT